MVLRTKLSYWLKYKGLTSFCCRAAMNMRKNELFISSDSSIGSSNKISLYPSVKKCSLYGRESQTLVCDIHGCLLRSQSFFPFFMLVAFEGGSIFRALLLLLSCPLLWILDYELKLRVMIFITFCALRLKDMDVVSRAVLPKFFLENLNLHVYDVFASAGCRLVFTSVPRVMVEGFLKEYLGVDHVKGTELHKVGQFYTGLLSSPGLLEKHRSLQEFCGENVPDIGIGSLAPHDQLSLSLCKEAYVVNKEDYGTCPRTVMPREKYPKPLVFHDGRLAFLPTPLATLTMFIWLPFAIILAVFRIIFVVFFPPKTASLLIRLTGTAQKFEVCKSPTSRSGKGVLYVCNHRTLLDPVYLSLALQKPITAVTYSLSKFSEVIAPIRTERLTRDRNQDANTIEKLLSEGDLVVCPEGTTCREPYLLRFSSLFAELTDDIVPVAVSAHVTMFYGTTAGGFKWLDPIFFAMNPRPYYSIQVLNKVPKEETVGGGKSSHEVANYIQRKLGDALGFECTSLTRRDKYLMLAGNEGFVPREKNKILE